MTAAHPNHNSSIRTKRQNQTCSYRQSRFFKIILSFLRNLDSSSVALTCAFNRRGTLLAVGCNDGRIAIWDFLTRGIAKMISAHAHTVCSLSWNRKGCKLVSSSTDNQVCVWNVLTGECQGQGFTRIRF